jgi:hypothetical protein
MIKNFINYIGSFFKKSPKHEVKVIHVGNDLEQVVLTDLSKLDDELLQASIKGNHKEIEKLRKLKVELRKHLKQDLGHESAFDEKTIQNKLTYVSNQGEVCGIEFVDVDHTEHYPQYAVECFDEQKRPRKKKDNLSYYAACPETPIAEIPKEIDLAETKPTEKTNPKRNSRKKQ